MNYLKLASVLIVMFLSFTTQANEVAIQNVTTKQQADGSWYFNVTLLHEDSGWNHYADLWVIEDKNGLELGRRVLWHPHVDEQPFTRGLGSVRIPANISTVYVKAHDKVHGWSKNVYKLKLK